MKKSYKADLLLLITSIIWGSAFVAQSMGTDHIGPFTFNAVRNFFATIALVIIIPFLSKNKKNTATNAHDNRTLIVGGIACGSALFIASFFQQAGIAFTTSGKAGFITTLYIVIVPLIGIFMGKKVSKKIWICVIIGAIGLYLLSITESFTISKGDLLIFICAIFFSIHILVIDYFSPKTDGVKMSAIQFFVCSILNFIFIFFFEKFDLQAVISAILPILYAAVMSSGVGYTLQIVAQKDTDPTIASLILSLESVFAVITGWLVLNESLSTREMLGCVIIFVAIIVAQLPERKSNKAI